MAKKDVFQEFVRRRLNLTMQRASVHNALHMAVAATYAMAGTIFIALLLLPAVSARAELITTTAPNWAQLEIGINDAIAAMPPPLMMRACRVHSGQDQLRLPISTPLREGGKTAEPHAQSNMRRVCECTRAYICAIFWFGEKSDASCARFGRAKSPPALPCCNPQGSPL